jgi:hypothetical protein
VTDLDGLEPRTDRAAPPLAPSQPAAAASPLLLQRVDSMSKGTLQLDSAPTSGNEKPSSATALPGGAEGGGAFCLSVQDDPLLQFPWGESGVVPAVWVGGLITLGVVAVTAWRAPALRRMNLAEMETSDAAG